MTGTLHSSFPTSHYAELAMPFMPEKTHSPTKVGALRSSPTDLRACVCLLCAGVYCLLFVIVFVVVFVGFLLLFPSLHVTRKRARSRNRRNSQGPDSSRREKNKRTWISCHWSHASSQSTWDAALCQGKRPLTLLGTRSATACGPSATPSARCSVQRVPPHRQHHLISPDRRSRYFLSSVSVGCASAKRSRSTACLSSASPALSVPAASVGAVVWWAGLPTTTAPAICCSELSTILYGLLRDFGGATFLVTHRGALPV